MNQPGLRRFHHKSAAGSQGDDKDCPYPLLRCEPPICDGTSSPVKNLQPDLAERRLRRRGALLMLYFLFQAEFGLAWDRSWHDYLGRDQFWIPPHIMSYTGIGMTGLVVLILVLIETVRYYQRKPGVDASSTISVLRVFAAPQGFVMLGFGTLTDLIAAPLDNYWHRLYGIDVTLWSPFHLLGLTGSIFAGVGLIYVFASEAVIARTSEHVPRRWLGLNGPEWTALFFFAVLIALSFIGLTAFKPVVLNAVPVITYPAALAFPAAFCLSGAVQLTRKVGSACLVALFVWGIALLMQIFVSWALHASSTIWHIPFRGGQEPVLNVVFMVLPLYFVLCALLIDRVFAWQNRKKGAKGALQDGWLIGALMAILAVFVPTGIARLLHVLVPGLAFPADVYQALLFDTIWPTLLLSLPLTLLVGMGSALAGSALGAKWYCNKR